MYRILNIPGEYFNLILQLFIIMNIIITITITITVVTITTWGRVLLKKLLAVKVVKKFPAFCDSRRFITMHIRDRYWSLS